jgi:cell division protein FtsZ
MGVGEDDNLEESIAVTIIATGFDVEQQNEISNTETKKVIHALEDDQNMEQDLTGKEKEPTIIKPTIELEEKKEAPQAIVKHTLDLDEEDLSDIEITQVNKPKNNSYQDLDLIPTSEFIKNIDVKYSEVDVVIDETEEFNIIDSNVNNIEVVKVEEEKKQQITLSFDMPLSEPVVDTIVEEEAPVIMNLSDDINNMEVNDFVEVIPVTESSEKGEVRYALDDYIEAESAINKVAEPKVEVDKEVVFERKQVEAEAVEVDADADAEVDPMNTPISELLKSRADERRKKMKNFNHKFNSSKIEDIEKIPAYKRQGLELNDSQHSSDNNISRTSLGVDDNDDIQLRSNNSFLHDNVD